MSKIYTYHRVEQEEYDKAIGQLRLQLNGVFAPFDLYGLGIFIVGAKEEVVELCEAFALRVRGKSVPIIVKRRRN